MGNETDISVFPIRCVSALPFSEEAFSSWEEGSDLRKFLLRLFDLDGVMVAPDGQRIPVNYRFYGDDLFNTTNESHRNLIEQLRETAGVTRTIESPNRFLLFVPDFADEPLLGKALKYLSAWKGVMSALMSESAAFSTAHLLESETDLNCSVFLMKDFYYRQSVQVLRSFLEDAVLQLHFCLDREAFGQWRGGGYRVPSLRRKTVGLLASLVVKNAISTDLEKVISELYDELNGFIHGSERHLIHRGMHTGDWRGHVFKNDDFLEWCNYLSRVVNAGLILMHKTTVEWLSFLQKHPHTCAICHNATDFKKTPILHAGVQHVRYDCLRCGWQMTFASEAI